MAICNECRIQFTPQEPTDLNLCPECATLREQVDIRKVVRYLKGHPHDTLVSIVAATGVPFLRVKNFIAGGPLERRSKPRE